MSIAQSLADANTHIENGRLEAAAAVYEKVLADAPETPEALYYSGMIAYERGDIDMALARLDRAIKVAPELGPLRADYGNVLRTLGRDADAVAQLEIALQLNPGDGASWLNLGLSKRALGDTATALDAVGRAIALLPPHAPAFNALGVVRRDAGNLAGAIEAFGRAAEIDPSSAESLSNLGMALHEAGRSDEALRALERAARANPAMAAVHVNFGTVYADTGDFESAEAAMARAVALDPGREEARGALLAMHHYHDNYTGEQLLVEAREWAKAAMATIKSPVPLAHANTRDPERRLRVGYLSPDFREHSCAHFLLPLFAGHDRAAVELFAYSVVEQPDQLTRKFEATVDRWLDGRRLSAVQLAECINTDRVDVLVDCAGLTRGNRLGTLAFRPAPVQITWLGFPGTTGLDAITYRITDALADPPGASDRQFSERLIRLPRPFLAWDPPPLNEAPRMPSGDAPFTFASFNNGSKITASVAQTWADIVNAVPGSRLLLKSGWRRWPRAEQRVRELFAAAGLQPERLNLVDWVVDHREHFAGYDQVDIALDPFPYNGTTTTFEALWMGVPVIALAGERHSGRVGVSLLTAAGLSELIAADRQAYVAAAVALAHDRDRRAALRATIRDKVAASPLVDARGFARAMEAVYRDLWRSWCAA
jgi:predicted O-linked N-acetylglucosamine transferase (SPINDLY family)